MSIRPRHGDAPEQRLSTLQTINAFFFGSDLEFKDRMGPPGKLDREYEYAVVAERDHSIVAFSFATLEGAQECARLEAMETVFVIPDSLKRGTRRFAHFVSTDGMPMRLGTARPAQDDAPSSSAASSSSQPEAARHHLRRLGHLGR